MIQWAWPSYPQCILRSDRERRERRREGERREGGPLLLHSLSK